MVSAKKTEFIEVFAYQIITKILIIGQYQQI